MNRLAKAAFFPLVAALLIGAGYGWGRHSFHLILGGAKTYGTITALLKYYDARADLIVAIDQEVVCTRASGVRVRGRMHNGKLTAVTVSSNGQATAVRLVDEPAHPLQTAVKELCDTDANGVKRFLMRQSVPSSTDRMQTIMRTEIVQVIPGVHGTLREISASNDMVLAVATDAGTFTRAAAYPIVTTMTFMMQTNDNGYVRSVNGATVPPPAFKDYFLFERDYRYSFRPIFSFAVSSTWYTVLADIGRRMTPPVAYPPFARVCLAYDPHNPQDALLTPDFAAFRKMTFLQRFNATTEAIFIRWLYPFLFFSTGGVLALVAVLIASLVLLPGPRHPLVQPRSDESIAASQ